MEQWAKKMIVDAVRAENEKCAEILHRLKTGKYEIVGQASTDWDAERAGIYQNFVEFLADQKSRGFLESDFVAERTSYENGEGVRLQNKHTGETARICMEFSTPLTKGDIVEIQSIESEFEAEKRNIAEENHEKLMAELEKIYSSKKIEKYSRYWNGRLKHENAHSVYDDLKEVELEMEEKIDEKMKKQEEEKRRINEEKHKKYIAERARWIREHGSDRLKTALNEGYAENSDRVYREERLSHECPGWEFSELESVEILNPTEDELDSLICAKKLPVEDPELVFVKKTTNEYGEIETTSEVYILARYMGKQISRLVCER